MADNNHFENGFIISAADNPISMKFDMLLHSLVPITVNY